MEKGSPIQIWLSAIVILLITSLGDPAALALTPDGLTLLEFKKGLTVASPLLENWKASDINPCSWGGISCTAGGEVQNITLFAQTPKLEGTVSSSLGKLRFLQELTLDQNSLSGSIPPELGNLSNLSTLSLSYNRLSGEIPPQLGDCSSLVELMLYNNHLSGSIPESLGNLEKLNNLDLSSNFLTGEIPLSVAALPNLYLFDVEQNLLTGSVPPIIYQNVNLKVYGVGDNSFTGDITTALEELSKLPAIEQISMEKNNFIGILPPSIGNASTLNVLSLWGQSGKFGGLIPKELGKLVNLTTLQLGMNNFYGEIPLELGNMTSLNHLHLSMNNLSGPIPKSFTSLINLKVLGLSYNNLSGPIPLNLSKTTTSLEEIYLFNNNMFGPIPEDFGRFMPNLTIIDIPYNFFNGVLPNDLCRGGKLQWLVVESNNLKGAIPSSLEACTSLTTVDLSYNQFTSIPNGLGKNSSLEYLDLSSNKITGLLPLGLGANSKVALIDLSKNRLTGDISSLEFSKLAQSLAVLNLANNFFTGEIPSAMAMCKFLFKVDLSYNFFTGIVPLALANLSNLEEIHLQSNELTWFSPSIYLKWVSALRILNLAENPWNAPIKFELGSLNRLQILNLSYGGFTGLVPSILGKLTQLEVLDLSHNNLKSEIPSELGELLISLVSLNVSFNCLTGPLPPAWVKFLHADSNSFIGNLGLCLKYDLRNMCVIRPSADSSGNLVGSRGKISTRVIVGVVLGILATFIIFVVFVFCWCRSIDTLNSKQILKVDIILKNLTNGPLPFTFEDIMAATKNMSDGHIIGRGCHGVVYKATLANGTQIVVKKIETLNVKTDLVHKSFWKEIESIGSAKHRNLVRLLGFVKWGEVGFLLYDYVSNGNLRAALHDKEQGLKLNWKARLCIAEGLAKGLAYLHHTHNPLVVHQDITSSNVLLDNDLEAQISDFGLSKVLDIMQLSSQQWSSTTPGVLGTCGYIAPEVGYSTMVTPKLDVYSYGVLLLELLTGKQPADDPSFGESLHVVAWVKEKVKQNKGKMSESVLDPYLLDVTNLSAKDDMLYVQGIGLLCTKEKPTNRPTMNEVVEMLTHLSLQGSNLTVNENENQSL